MEWYGLEKKTSIILDDLTKSKASWQKITCTGYIVIRVSQQLGLQNCQMGVNNSGLLSLWVWVKPMHVHFHLYGNFITLSSLGYNIILFQWFNGPSLILDSDYMWSTSSKKLVLDMYLSSMPELSSM